MYAFSLYDSGQCCPVQLREVEEDCNEKKKHCELLEEELKNLKEECSATEYNLSTQLAELKPRSEQLKVIQSSAQNSSWPLAIFRPILANG